MIRDIIVVLGATYCKPRASGDDPVCGNRPVSHPL